MEWSDGLYEPNSRKHRAAPGWLLRTARFRSRGSCPAAPAAGGPRRLRSPTLFLRTSQALARRANPTRRSPPPRPREPPTRRHRRGQIGDLAAGDELLHRCCRPRSASDYASGTLRVTLRLPNLSHILLAAPGDPSATKNAKQKGQGLRACCRRSRRVGPSAWRRHEQAGWPLNERQLSCPVLPRGCEEMRSSHRRCCWKTAGVKFLETLESDRAVPQFGISDRDICGRSGSQSQRGCTATAREELNGGLLRKRFSRRRLKALHDKVRVLAISVSRR